MSSTAPPEPTVPPPSTGEEEGHLRRWLGTPSLVLFGLVYMVPLTVFTTYGLVTQMTGGRVPVAYLVTLAAMVFTARSYARMAAAYPVAGSAYTYAQKSFGAPIGFLAGWSLLLDYLFLPMLNYLVIGIYINAAIPAIPPWVVVIVTIGIVTVLNIVGIVSVDRANFVIIAVQAIFIVVFIVMACVTLSGSGTVTLDGRAARQVVEVDGSGQYDARRLDSETGDVTISGSGSADVEVSGFLVAVVTGSGTVTYGGGGQVEKHVDGSGSVEER